MNGIHRGWLQPMPSYWHDFDFRDDPRLDPDWRPSISETPRACMICGGAYTISGPNANHRKVCYRQECTDERKRRNRIRSRRVAT